MRYRAILNRDGGTFRTIDMDDFCAQAREVFSRRGHELVCDIVSGENLLPALERAAADSGIDAMLVGGGDGTISAAAGVAFAAGKPLAVLPAGTMNLFARSLAIPLDLDEALEALADGEVQQADIATANGRPFVHQFSVGIHTRLVQIRETLEYNGRAQKMAASVRAFIAAISRPPNFSAEIRTDRGLERRRISGISVTNNPLAEGHVPHADGLDQGVLGVYVARPMTGMQMLRFCIGLFAGHWKANPFVSERAVRQLTLEFPARKASAKALIDGELLDLEPRVKLEIHPGALTVVVPARAVAAVAA
jgi:diacylglycerol kinase family enzyme